MEAHRSCRAFGGIDVCGVIMYVCVRRMVCVIHEQQNKQKCVRVIMYVCVRRMYVCVCVCVIHEQQTNKKQKKRIIIIIVVIGFCLYFLFF